MPPWNVAHLFASYNVLFADQQDQGTEGYACDLDLAECELVGDGSIEVEISSETS